MQRSCVGSCFAGRFDQFPDIGSHIVFVNDGSVRGQAYGTGGQGSGAMPGFGRLYTADQIDAVVRYERGL